MSAVTSTEKDGTK